MVSSKVIVVCPATFRYHERERIFLLQRSRKLQSDNPHTLLASRTIHEPSNNLASQVERTKLINGQIDELRSLPVALLIS